MVKLDSLLIDQVVGRKQREAVTIEEARGLRGAAKKKREIATFICPICKQTASPHGGKVPLHGEHSRGSAKCEPSTSICKES